MSASKAILIARTKLEQHKSYKHKINPNKHTNTVNKIIQDFLN